MGIDVEFGMGGGFADKEPGAEELVCRPTPLIEEPNQSVQPVEPNQSVAPDPPNQSVMPPQTPQVCEGQPTIDMTKGGQSVPITEPTTVKSALGDMQVYPDDFVGPLPPGAVRASEHSKMLGIMTGIDAGTSQISVDTSNFTAGKDIFTDPLGYMKALQDAQNFKDQYTGYLRDLVKTPTGLQLLSQLDSSKYKTKIQQGPTNQTINDNVPNSLLNADKTKNVGTGSTIEMDPTATTYAKAGQVEQPWMTDRPRFGFYHELTHAYHDSQGETATGKHNGVNNWEWQVMGMGDYSKEAVSDNAIRKDFGKDQRPNYGGVTW